MWSKNNKNFTDQIPLASMDHIDRIVTSIQQSINVRFTIPSSMTAEWLNENWNELRTMTAPKWDRYHHIKNANTTIWIDQIDIARLSFSFLFLFFSLLFFFASFHLNFISNDVTCSTQIVSLYLSLSFFLTQSFEEKKKKNLFDNNWFASRFIPLCLYLVSLLLLDSPSKPQNDDNFCNN